LIYTELFGGFDDLGDEDSEEEEEDLTGVTLTKSGYMKDSFITDDDDIDSDNDYIDEKIEVTKGNRQRISKKKISSEDMVSESDEEDSDFFVCTDELEEENYE
jgi:hypothetical protein